MLRRLLAEALGTFCIIFAGTGAIVVNEQLGGVVTHVGVSLVFGLVVLVMIVVFSGVSGAHLNPAVTAGLVLARRFPLRGAPAYVGAQSAGALTASGVLKALFPTSERLGATSPSGPEWQSFMVEVVLATMLMLVVLSLSERVDAGGVSRGIGVGGVVAMGALFAGPISGASMNPARSLAPALVSGDVASLWVYLLAPTAGSALGVGCWSLLRPTNNGTGGVPAADAPALPMGSGRRARRAAPEPGQIALRRSWFAVFWRS